MPSREDDDSDDDFNDDDHDQEAALLESSSGIDTSWCSNDDPDTMRILLSTDNHLGYNERDPVRGNDSFAAFEEVLYTARRFHCDFVLLSGDLFHENRPSRRTYHKTMEILKRYCMGPDSVRIECLSDVTKQFRSANNVNYQDPNYSVQLPIFSIHGNHDDPSRDQGGGELLAALDLLAVNNLVNYFGRQDEVDKVDIAPILLQKGNTKVALYGLGSLRDERLNRMWERQKVRFCRPADDGRNGNNDDEDEEEEDDDEDEGFFNIFTLHQNRDLGRGSKNCVQESMIPDWMDLVVWGHEHECLIEFFESVVGTFRITQPGSSVATSLVPGEAARKKVGILDIKGRNFRLHPVPLTQCRSFVTTSLSLREHRAELDPEDPKIDSKITAMLVEEVELMRKNALDRMEEVLADARKAGNDAGEKDCSLKYKLHRPEEVLVRIRVEHSGFSTINNQRFGAQFVGKVANPSDILLFHRKKDPSLASTVKKKGIQPVPPEELERTDMFDLIKGQLEAPDSKLSFFKESDLSLALDDYVEKGVTQAITELATESLAVKQKVLVEQQQKSNISIEKESQICDLLDREASHTEASMDIEEEGEVIKKNGSLPNDPEKENSLDPDLDGNDESSKPVKGTSSSAKKAQVRNGIAKKPKTKRRRPDDSDSAGEDHAIPENALISNSKPTTRPQRGGAQRKRVYNFEDSDNEDEDAFVLDDDHDNSDDEEVAVQKQASKRKPNSKVAGGTRKATSTKTATSRQTTNSGTARKKQPRNKVSRRHQFDDSDDDSVEYLGESAGLDANWGSAATKSQRWS